MNPNGKPLLQEEQYFRSQWTGWLILGGALLITGIMVFAAPGLQCAADRSEEEAWLIWGLTGLMAVINVALFYLFFYGRLVTEIHPDGIAVQLVSLTRRHFFTWNEIESVEARTYRPIFEYGGWGLRGIGKNKAYNVSGNEGLQLVFKDGRRLLIGSQMGPALEAAARKAMEKVGK